MSVTRSTLVAGPAKIVRDTLITYSKDDVSIRMNHSTFPVVTAAHGTVDTRSLDQIVEATFTPSGQWTDAIAAALWPYANTTVGASIFSSDVATVFHGSDGTSHEIPASAITQMPSLRLSAAESMIGPVTITGIRKDATAWGTALSIYDPVKGASTFADADTPYTTALITTQSYTATWGTTGSATTAIPGFDTAAPFNTVDGWTIDFDLSLAPIVVDEMGTVDYRFVDLVVRARCIPIETTVAEIMNAANFQGTGGTSAARGRSVSDVLTNPVSADLVITGADAGTIITITQAGITGLGFMFGASTLRNGEVEWTSRRSFTNGATDALFTLVTPNN